MLRGETREIGRTGRLGPRSSDSIPRMLCFEQGNDMICLFFKRLLCLTVWKAASSEARVEAGRPAERWDGGERGGVWMRVGRCGSFQDIL